MDPAIRISLPLLQYLLRMRLPRPSGALISLTSVKPIKLIIADRMGEMEHWMDENFVKGVILTLLNQQVQVKVIRDRNSGYVLCLPLTYPGRSADVPSPCSIQSHRPT